MPHTVQMCLYKPVRKVSHNHSSAETSSLVKQDIVELLMEDYIYIWAYSDRPKWDIWLYLCWLNEVQSFAHSKAISRLFGGASRGKRKSDLLR